MITFTADGKDYKLEVTAWTIKFMENKLGINFPDLPDKVLGAETLWKGLFIAHHNDVPDKKRMEIYNAMQATEDGAEPELDDNGEPIDTLMTAVGAEYERALEALKRSQGNVAWKVI